MGSSSEIRINFNGIKSKWNKLIENKRTKKKQRPFSGGMAFKCKDGNDSCNVTANQICWYCYLANDYKALGMEKMKASKIDQWQFGYDHFLTNFLGS